MKCIYISMLLALASLQAIAQETPADTSGKKKKSISIGSDGIRVNESDKKDKEEKVFDVQVGMLDLGINNISDNTNYNDPNLQNFLNVNPELQNENLFSLREGKSVNVNVYPVMMSYRLLKTKGQKISLVSGIGLQMYNFRFNRPVTYINETTPMVVMNDSTHLSKNKLGFTYLTIPLSLNFKTKLAKDAWLVYGFGISEGYRIASWTKQKSEQYGKQKNHDQFNFSSFITCLTAEIGLDDYFRLYASYQLTSLHKDYLDQHPYCIGVRFMGI